MLIDIDLIKSHVINGKIDLALIELCEGTKSTTFEIDSIVIASNYNKWKQEKKLGIIDDRQEQLIYNKVIISVIEILNEITTKFLHNELKYKEVRFFETPMENLTLRENRIYCKSFDHKTTKHIGWELLINSPRLKVDLNNYVKWFIDLPSGEATPSYSTEFRFTKGWSNPWVAGSWGKKSYDQLDIGCYTIYFEIQGKQVIEGQFFLE
ncbi:MAG: hypothetical protein KDD14_05300 [Saprospiraceae bacterium]|nr:hypothetical protein [Saprospiraceae bacterium]